jgi:ApbE superfamily uncharacterized protein (UPF0280 family)
MTALAALLPDGRLHLQHGPIDCLCQAWGSPTEIRAAYHQAAARFETVLTELCAELPALRRPLPSPPPQGAIAHTMHAACAPFAARFITPMAAVAGAVADAVLAAMCHGRALDRAFVNNGGDIAYHLAPGNVLRCGLITDLTAGTPPRPDLSSPVAHGPAAPILSSPVAHGPAAPILSSPVAHGPAAPALSSRGAKRRGDLARISPPGADHSEDRRTASPLLDGTFLLTAAHPARGLATSGRACKGQGGRSFSFGIADSVSILARTAAQADAAATIVANAVDLPAHPAIDRRPASTIDPNTDLGDRLVTYNVGPISDETIAAALDAGATMADNLLQAGLIEGAVLALRGRLRIRHLSLASQEVA